MAEPRRQPRDRTRLGRQLADLENCDPMVRAAAERLDEVFQRRAWEAETGMDQVRRGLWEAPSCPDCKGFGCIEVNDGSLRVCAPCSGTGTDAT
jgi:hypothetical protein